MQITCYKRATLEIIEPLGVENDFIGLIKINASSWSGGARSRPQVGLARLPASGGTCFHVGAAMKVRFDLRPCPTANLVR